MRTASRVVVASLASGVFWVLVLATLGGRPLGWLTRGGAGLAPLIGLGAGWGSRFFPTGRWRRALFSIVSLYAAAALFGVSVGAYDLATGGEFGARLAPRAECHADAVGLVAALGPDLQRVSRDLVAARVRQPLGDVPPLGTC